MEAHDVSPNAYILMKSLLTIHNVHASVEDKEILKGLSLTINAGEVHAIMGPNGAGKSTLASVLTGKDGYTVQSGTITFDGNDIIDEQPEIRARMGLFLAFQHPVEIPGVSTENFLRTSLNEIRRYRGQETLDALDFHEYVREKAKIIDLKEEFLTRSFNEGFSGGEKKRVEILQMALLEPKLAILDEIDSGLDIDSLKKIASAVTALKKEDNACLLVTHYQRLLHHIEPDFVHVFYDGKIIRSGDKSLAHVLEEKGYDWVIEEYLANTAQ